MGSLHISGGSDERKIKHTRKGGTLGANQNKMSRHSSKAQKTRRSHSGGKGKRFRSSSLVKSIEMEKTNVNASATESEKDAEDVNNPTLFDLITIEDAPADRESTSENEILADVLRGNDNFVSPRRLLSSATYPEVDGSLTAFEIATSRNDIQLTDPTTVTTLPPQSLLLEIDEELKNNKDHLGTFKFPGYVVFNKEGIRVLGRFHWIKSLRRQVQFEETWLKQAFRDVEFEQEVTEALLDRWNKDGRFLATYPNYQITSQGLSLLAGERYLCDPIINLLIQK